MLPLFASFMVVAAASSPTTVEIAPGVIMPVVSMGGVVQKPSNYSMWLELGGRGLDTARTYGDDVQRKVGQAMKASGISRSEIFLTTKIPCCPAAQPFGALCKDRTAASAPDDIERDLALLGVDYVDLMLLHWPCSKPEDTISVYRAMEKMVEQKKARAIGISNFNASAIDSLLKEVKVKPVVNQCGFSIGNHDTELFGGSLQTLGHCKKLGITYEAYSPLGGITGVDVLGDPTVKGVAKAHNKSTAQVALRWISQQGGIVVTASDKASHDQTDLDIFDFDLTDDEMTKLTQVGAATLLV